MYSTCNTRSSPKALFDAIHGLIEERKRFFKQIGFERYINIPIVELPSTLAYHIINNFHIPSMELRVQKGSIKATRQKVHDILSIPMWNTKLQDLEQRHANYPFIAEWEAQYSHLLKSTPPAIALQISEEDDIADIDWCAYILDCLRTSKLNWTDVKTKKNYYYRPLTFLCTSNQKLEHSNDEEKNQDGNKSKMLGKSRTPW
ncbi:hypothetical protein Tco_1487502 [Tanacetum coccineum]